MTTPCPSSAELRGLVNGSLSDGEADSLQLHLERCETCQNALQEIVADGDFWKSAAEELSNDEAAGPGLERIVEELQQQSPEDAEEMGEAIELKLSFIDPPTEPGTIGRLKHYDILRVAGRGGMGIVLKAFDRTLRRVVAVKMLAPHLAGNGQARQRFVREGRAAAGICHEHVVTIHAVEETPPFIVMQYVKGETLEARIHRNGSLEVREAIRIAKQIAQGLAAAHTQGVMHRDIKPANILLENGVARVRITDFGLARAVDDASLTQSGVVAGTPQYMAPEQANGDAVDERADLFSLGSVLYTMLAGHAPFRATTTMGVLKRLCDNTARPIREINPEVPDWLVVMINRLHAKRPADRYQSAQEVADMLERGLAAMQSGAAPTIEFAQVGSESVVEPVSVVADSPSATRRDSLASGQASSRAGEVPLPKWLLPIPVWLVVIALLLVMLGPLGQEASIIATMLLIGLCFVGMLVYFVKKLMIEPEPVSENGTTSPLVDHSFEGRSRRLLKRLCEITPASWSGRLGWLMLWCLPVAVWIGMFYLQEEFALRMHIESLPDRDRDIVITLAGVFCLWWAIAIAWFRRRREDGSRLFERGRWLRVLTTLLFATVFCLIGYDVWYSDVYRLKLFYHDRQESPFYTGRSMRPWEFQTDGSRGHTLFAMVRSRESASLRDKLAFEPVKLEERPDMVRESVSAWAKRLKIDAEGTNSVGMELVLMPSAVYHLVDAPALTEIRRELPEPGSIRDSVTDGQQPTYRIPKGVENRLSTNYKFVSYPFVMSRNPVSIKQFQQFISETGYVTDAERRDPKLPEASTTSDTGSPIESGTSADDKAADDAPAETASVTQINGGWQRQNGLFDWKAGLSWKNPMPIEVDVLDRPVSVVSWHDATEFCKWLTEKESRQYRLPTDAEWTAAMQLGADRKQLPATNIDDAPLRDYRGWFGMTLKHPLGIDRTPATFAEWTQDAQFGSTPSKMVLVHTEISADKTRLYWGIQYSADPSFRAAEVGFRVVAELQTLAGEKPAEEPSDPPRAEPASGFQESHSS